MTAMARDINIDPFTLDRDNLDGLDEPEFRQVVATDLRRTASNRSIRTTVPGWLTEALRGPLAERRLAALYQMLASVECQLEMMDPDRDRTSALRFRAALLEALPEAERLAHGRAHRLEGAIRAHRDATVADPTIEPGTADTALWSLLTD